MKNKFFADIDKKWKEYALAGCVTVLFFVCIMHIGIIWGIISKVFSVMKPIFFGVVIAYIINPLANRIDKFSIRFIKKEKLRWLLSVVVALIIVLLLISLLIASLIPSITQNAKAFTENYPFYVQHLREIVDNNGGILGNIPVLDGFLDSLDPNNGFVSQIGSLLSEHSDALINAGNTALSWLIGFIFAIYFLMAKDNIKRVFQRAFSLILSPVRYDNGRTIFVKFNAIFSKYIVCQLVDSCIIGLANYAFMAVMKMPDELLLSVIMGLTNLAPTFGPVVGALIGAFILLLEKPVAILPFLICTVILQFMDAYVIKPKLFGDALDVPGVIILIAIIVFGKLMGVVGMLIAIPAAAILVYIYEQLFIPWLELKRDLKNYNKEKSRERNI